MLNCCVFMGRLTADPELRTTSTGLTMTRFTIAVDRSYTKPGEEKQADFINIVAWRSTAEFITRYFRKGSMIAVQGSLQTGSYEDKNGIKRTSYDVIVDRASFCGSKAESGTAGVPADNAAHQGSAYSTSTPDDFSTVVDDDLPF